jgi:hypothetical protein
VLLARALEAASTPTAAPVTLSTHRARRARGESWRRVGTAVAAAAAVLVLVAGIAALVKVSGRGSSSSDSASSATAADGASVSSTTTGSGADSARAAAGVVPPDLGSLPDAAVVLDRYALLTDLDPTVAHQFELGSASGSGSATAEGSNQAPAADASTLPSMACPVPPVTVAVAPGERWTVTATARLPEGPVVVMGNGLASPTNRLLVVDAATCAVLDERTI